MGKLNQHENTRRQPHGRMKKAAIDQFAKDPSWRATRVLNAASTRALQYRVQRSLWVALLVALIVLVAWLLRIG